jgi:hypothetical protein
MYGKSGIVGVTGGLAATGFASAWYLLLASTLVLSGLLLLRWGRRRGEAR